MTANCESQTESGLPFAPRRLSLAETLKDPGKEVRADTFARVQNFYLHSGELAFQPDFNRALLWCELNGIGK